MSPESRLFCPVSDEILLEITRNTLGPSANIAERMLLSGGKFNTTYRVRTVSPDRDIVIRLAPVLQDLLYRFERSLQRAETEIYGLLESRGVPVPKVIKYDDSRSIVDREYIVTSYIEGIPLEDAQLSGTGLQVVIRSVGKYCRRIHSITGDGFGWFGMRNDGGLAETWHGFLWEFFEEISSRSERFGVTPRKHIRKLENILSQNPSLFPDPHPIALLHNDLHSGNVLVRKVGEVFKVSALIDADRAFFGDPDFEFGTSELTEETGFRIGYCLPLSQSPESLFRRKIYSLIKNMMDADACLVQLGNTRVHGILENCIETCCDSL